MASAAPHEKYCSVSQSKTTSPAADHDIHSNCRCGIEHRGRQKANGNLLQLTVVRLQRTHVEHLHSLLG